MVKLVVQSMSATANLKYISLFAPLFLLIVTLKNDVESFRLKHRSLLLIFDFDEE